jgi:hypothetical protein
VLEDQQAFSPVEDGVGVRKAPVVTDIVEVFQHRDGRLQDAFRHLGFDQVQFLELFHVLSNQTMQGFIPIYRHTVLLAQRADVGGCERVKSVES